MHQKARLTYIDVDAPVPQQERWFFRSALLFRRFIPLWLVILAAYRFVGLSFGEMQQWDESIYALRTMGVLNFGDLWDQSVHMIGGVYYSAHPPLFVWLTGSAVLLIGEQLWVFRLVSAAAAALIVPLLYRMASLSMSRGWAFSVTAFFALAPLPVFFSRQGQLDMLLTLFMLATLYFVLRYLREQKTGLIVSAGCMLGLALMVKFLFALSIPAALALSALGAREGQRGRLVKTALLLTVVSLPIWLPWVVSFTAMHGNGNVLFMFSDAVPFGATMAGREGTPQDLGSLYYLNQLVVHLSFFFPFAVAGLFRLFVSRSSETFRLFAAFVAVYLIALWFAGSAFAVYLIPVLPVMLILAVWEFRDMRLKSISYRFVMAVLMSFCGVWSLSHDLRVVVKQSLIDIVTIMQLPGGDILWQLAFIVVLMSLAFYVPIRLRSRGKLRSLYVATVPYVLIAAMGLATLYRIYFVDPEEYVDGAQAVCAAVSEMETGDVVLVGNGENPQLTFYLDGADIGWPSSQGKTFTRLEPKSVGVDMIKRRLSELAAERNIAVILEKENRNVQVHPEFVDILPASHDIVLETTGYTLVLLQAR